MHSAGGLRVSERPLSQSRRRNRRIAFRGIAVYDGLMHGHPPGRKTLLVALAVLAFVNITLSYASVETRHSTSPTHDCATQMPAGAGDCPCCPDDPGVLAGCLSVCGAHAFAAAMLPPALPVSKGADTPFVGVEPATTVYPPPDPPPIV